MIDSGLWADYSKMKNALQTEQARLSPLFGGKTGLAVQQGSAAG